MRITIHRRHRAARFHGEQQPSFLSFGVAHPQRHAWWATTIYVHFKTPRRWYFAPRLRSMCVPSSFRTGVALARKHRGWHYFEHTHTGYSFWVSCPDWVITVGAQLVYLRTVARATWSGFACGFVTWF